MRTDDPEVNWQLQQNARAAKAKWQAGSPQSDIYGMMPKLMGHGDQGAHLAGMAGQAMGAIQRENDSRVSQARDQAEYERYAAEQEKAHQREMQKLQLIARLEQEAALTPRPGFYTTRGRR